MDGLGVRFPIEFASILPLRPSKGGAHAQVCVFARGAKFPADYAATYEEIDYVSGGAGIFWKLNRAGGGWIQGAASLR